MPKPFNDEQKLIFLEAEFSAQKIVQSSDARLRFRLRMEVIQATSLADLKERIHRIINECSTLEIAAEEFFAGKAGPPGGTVVMDERKCR